MKMLTKIINLTFLLQINLVWSFDVYWNIPSIMCKKYVNFTDLNSMYGILQNEGDFFRGNVISILYDPGEFPALLADGDKRSKKSKLYKRNGGVPQEGDVDRHIAQYIKDVNEQIPDVYYDGQAIIDFESWRPVFRQNFGSLQPYKDLSFEIERKNHPMWSQSRVEAEAARRFEEKGREFVEKTMKKSRELRPHAKWGYYAFPYCFNNKGEDYCSKQTMDENTRSSWLFSNANTILPSVYLQEKLTPQQRQNLVKGRVKEAMRMSNMVGKLPVYVYIRYVYTDSLNLLTKTDLVNVFNVAKNNGAKGMLLWGSSNDLKSMENCMKFEKYVRDVLGPVSRSFTSSKILVKNILSETY